MDNGNYIMEEAMFNQLCNVRGFNNLNGNTYKEHIIICMKNRLSEELQNKIVNAKDGNGALSILNENNIYYTHEYYKEY